MRILVLGGTGAMGKALVPILVSRGLEVTATSRTEQPSQGNLTWRRGDAHDGAFLEELMKERLDAVVDFMTYTAEAFSARMDRLLSGTDQYIFLSSSRVYADAGGAIREDSPRLLDTPPTRAYLTLKEYALEKARGEDLLAGSGRKNWTVVRPYITYNSNRLQLGVMEKELWLQRALERQTIVFPKAISERLTTLTYGGDVAAVIAELIGNPAALGERVHIASPEPVRWSEVLGVYCDVLEERTGKRPRVFLTEDLNPSSKKAYLRAQVYYDRLYDRVFSIEKAERLCGHKLRFVRPQDGLKRCLEEFLDGDRQFLYRHWNYETYADHVTGEPWRLERFPTLRRKAGYGLRRCLAAVCPSRIYP